VDKLTAWKKEWLTSPSPSKANSKENKANSATKEEGNIHNTGVSETENSQLDIPQLRKQLEKNTSRSARANRRRGSRRAILATPYQKSKAQYDAYFKAAWNAKEVNEAPGPLKYYT
jgi:hypothetical protein